MRRETSLFGASTRAPPLPTYQAPLDDDRVQDDGQLRGTSQAAILNDARER